MNRAAAAARFINTFAVAVSPAPILTDRHRLPYFIKRICQGLFWATRVSRATPGTSKVRTAAACGAADDRTLEGFRCSGMVRIVNSASVGVCRLDIERVVVGRKGCVH